MPKSFTEAEFLAHVAAVQAQDPVLSPLMAGIVTALFLEIAADSRIFAKLFGIEHALVLREINQLTDPDAPVVIARRDARTQRTYLKLTVKGEALCRLIP
ncbi:hypothetical protein [Pararhizobium sp.]|uniref:hypothetical protein n=1 Tax=Pararhizobium sp. TaxID=1977563 RepID=UPI003D0FCCE9